jgi:hypothetical protein
MKRLIEESETRDGDPKSKKIWEMTDKKLVRRLNEDARPNEEPNHFGTAPHKSHS